MAKVKEARFYENNQIIDLVFVTDEGQLLPYLSTIFSSTNPFIEQAFLDLLKPKNKTE